MRSENKLMNIEEIRRMYLDVSSIKKEYFKKYIEKNKITLCVSELTLLEIKNEKAYGRIPNEDFVDQLLQTVVVLKVNNQILELAKKLVKENKLPKEQYNDALHIAIAKYYRCYTILYDSEAINQKNLRNYNLQCTIN